MSVIEPFSSQQIKAVSRVPADTNDGLSGSAIAFVHCDASIASSICTRSRRRTVGSIVRSHSSGVYLALPLEVHL